MYKDGYEFLEALECVDDSFIYEAGQPWDKERKKEGRKYGLKAACFLLGALLGLGGMFHRQVEAAISSFTTRIAAVLGVRNDLSPYAEVVNSSQTKEGITVTLNEVMLMGQELLVSFDVKPEDSQRMDDIGAAIDDTVKINKTVCRNESNIFHDFMEGYTAHKYVETFSFKEGAVTKEPVEFEVGLTVYLYENSQVGRKTEDALKIPFTFSFSAAEPDIEVKSLEVSVEHKLEAVDGSVMELTGFSLNPIASAISARSEEIIDPSGYYLKGVDSEGNELLYHMNTVIRDKEEFSGYEYSFTNDWGDTMPSIDSQWVELQLYYLELPDTDEGYSIVEGEAPEGGVSNYTVTHLDGEIEELKDEITIGMDEMKPVGEKFRIELGEG